MLVLLRCLVVRWFQAAEVGEDVTRLAQRQNAEHGGLMEMHQINFYALSDMSDPFLDVILTHRFLPYESLHFLF